MSRSKHIVCTITLENILSLSPIDFSHCGSFLHSEDSPQAPILILGLLLT